jgi:uncharacterized surface protein with fasciclin (FAS1) repeats
MKKIILILSLFAIICMNYSCKQVESDIPGFKDVIPYTIYDIVKADTNSQFSSFLAILQKAGIDKTLSAYNPHDDGYTLFLPDNNAVDRFIQNSGRFGSLNDLLNDQDFVNLFARYHVISKGIRSNDFPFGAFTQPTLSEDFLAVSFVIEPDTAYYKINNQAPVYFPDIETSNGWIHLITEVLKPVTLTTYGWLAQNSNYSIFKSAVDATGFRGAIDLNLKSNLLAQPLTLLVEADSIFKKNKINSFNDLAKLISPNSTNYSNPNNTLYNFVGYHVVTGNYFLDDFEGVATNYSTMSDVPVNINGTGIDIAINLGKQVFDTIIAGKDTTIINYIGINYDNSNLITQSGAIHFIDRVMMQQRPSIAEITYQFFEEMAFNEFRREPATYLIDNPEILTRISYTGADLSFVKLVTGSNTAWSDDYIQIDGDFTISYKIPKIVQGKYYVYLQAEAFSADNALVEVFIDGKKVGGLIDLTRGGNSGNPFSEFRLGTIDFVKYSEHTVLIKSLIPGRFLWDYIQFTPY